MQSVHVSERCDLHRPMASQYGALVYVFVVHAACALDPPGDFGGFSVFFCNHDRSEQILRKGGVRAGGCGNLNRVARSIRRPSDRVQIGLFQIDMCPYFTLESAQVVTSRRERQHVACADRLPIRATRTGVLTYRSVASSRYCTDILLLEGSRSLARKATVDR